MSENLNDSLAAEVEEQEMNENDVQQNHTPLENRETSMPEQTNNSRKTVIKVSEIIEKLEEGYTRTKDDKNYNPEIGSIEEEYNLDAEDVKLMFKHPALKGKRTKAVPVTNFVLEDDTKSENSEE